MYYKQVENENIYYPKQIPSSINQKTFYSDNLQRQISDIEKSYKDLFESLERRHSVLEKKTINLDASCLKSTRLQRATNHRLSHKLEAISENNNVLEKKTISLGASCLELTRLQKGMNLRLSNQLEAINKNHNVLEKKTINLEASCLEASRLQKAMNLRLSNQLEAINDNHNLFLERQNKYESLLDAEVIPFMEQQADVNENVLKQLAEHKTIIVKELMPFISNIEKNLETPIINLLNNLSPGTSIQQLTVRGAKIKVKSFIDYNLFTNVSTFLLDNNHVLSVDSNKIDSLRFS